MGKKRLLLVRSKNDVFLHTLIDNLNKNQLLIDLLDLKNGELINLNNSNSIQLCNINQSKSRTLRYFLRYISGLVFLLSHLKGKYDVVHVINIKRDNFWLFPFFSRHTNKMIVSVYGRSTYLYHTKRILFSPFLKYVDYFAFSNQALIHEFSKYYPKVSQSKLIRLIMPTANISSNKLDIQDDAVLNFCNKFQINLNLIKVSCSSTISSYDQHDKVIEAVSKIRNKDKVQLMFLLTYGGTENEKQRIISKIKSELHGFNFAIIDNFLSNEELAAYRKLTDIYINMRISDQMAGAVIESLYEGALLLSASWLNYQTLDDIGVTYYKVPTFDTLQQMIDDKIHAIQSFKQEYAKKNRNKILKEFSLESTINKWTNLYTS